jgi:hypothetical protein
MTMNIAAIVLFSLVAQPAPPSASPEAKTRAQALLKEGAKLYEKGDLADALEKFNQAYESYASPKLLFNIGQASRGLGRPVDAIEAFERFLAEVKDAPADMTDEARVSVSELQAKVGRLLIECSIAGAEVSVDGKIVGTSPIEKLIAAIPGGHQVVARHPAAQTAVEEVQVSAGMLQTVVMRLQLLAASAELPPGVVPAGQGHATAETSPPQPTMEREATPPTSPEVSRMKQGWWLGRKWTWVAAGSSVLLVGSAAILGRSMQSKYDALEKSCGQSSSSQLGCGDSQVNSVVTRRNAANVFWGLAGAAVVTTGVLFLVEGRAVSVAPMAGETMGLLAQVRY